MSLLFKRLAAAGVLAIAVVAAGVRLWLCADDGPVVAVVGRAPCGARLESSVPVEWATGETNLARAYGGREQPVVVRGSLVSSVWRAARTWSPAVLREAAFAGQVMLEVSANSTRGDGVFGPIWRPNQPMAQVVSVRRRNPHAQRTMSLREFFRRSDGGELLYYSGDLDAVAPWMARDVEPLGPVLVRPEQSQVNVWIGSPGVRAHGHYDSYSNIYAQLHGRKRFVVAAPGEWRNLELFPWTHPSPAQLQHDLLDPPPVADDPGPGVPWAARASLSEVTLLPGDVFVLPLGWFHTVECVPGFGPCVSVNAWAVTEQSAAMERVQDALVTLARGLEDRLGPEADGGLRRLRAAATLLRHLDVGADAGRVRRRPARPGSREPAPAAVEALLATRFDGLFRAGELPREHPDPDVARTMCSAAAGLAHRDAEVVDLAVAASRSANDAAAAGLPAETRSVWMLNFAEQVALWATNAEYVGAWLHSCFG